MSIQLRSSNLQQDAAARIRDLIFAGDLRPGEKIDQDRLAAGMGVSRLPIREALIALERQGLVRSVARRGAFVAPLTRADMRDHYEIFAEMSAMAAGRAASGLTPDQVEELQQIGDRMAATSNVDELERLNYEFHSRITKASGSHQLAWFIGLLESSVPRGFHLGGWDMAREQHQAILDCLSEADAAGASQAMRKHIMESGDHALHALERDGFWALAEGAEQSGNGAG